MKFPTVRMRRLRENSLVRNLVSETRLSLDEFVMPLFVVEGLSGKEPIKSMPGQFRYSANELITECKKLSDAGIKSVILFGIPVRKDPKGSGAWAPKGIVQQAIHALKKSVPQMLVIADLCLCEYTSHGHCGVVSRDRILNDPTLELLAKTALSQAKAGADVIAPSDMMDGRVQAIRRGLDQNGFEHIPIMSYAAKHASAFYGPFRDAAESAPQFGDRRSYQMEPGNSREALREIELDIAEGADIIMVKPALAYLDVISAARQNFKVPIAAYNVSGEYAMVKAAAAHGWVDEKRVVLEILIAIKRAGAQIVLTYHAAQVAKEGWLFD